MHIGKLYFEKALTPSYLLNFMGENEIEKAALLPIENPEETYYYVTTEEVLKVCKEYPDRFIPFCNVDPRRGNADTSTDFYRIIKEYKEKGCKGFSDLSAGSGFNAITRDPEFGYQFLEKFQDKLFFGTDLCHINQKIPIISYLKKSLKKSKISKAVYDKITCENAQKILKW